MIWAQIRYNRIRLIIEAEHPPYPAVWVNISEIDPLPEVGDLYDAVSSTFSTPPALPILDTTVLDNLNDVQKRRLIAFIMSLTNREVSK